MMFMTLGDCGDGNGDNPDLLRYIGIGSGRSGENKKIVSNLNVDIIIIILFCVCRSVMR